MTLLSYFPKFNKVKGKTMHLFTINLLSYKYTTFIILFRFTRIPEIPNAFERIFVGQSAAHSIVSILLQIWRIII